MSYFCCNFTWSLIYIIFYLLYASSFYLGQGKIYIVCILLIILIYSIIIIDKLSYIFKKDKNKHHLDQLISFFQSNDSDLNVYISSEEEDIVTIKLN